MGATFVEFEIARREAHERVPEYLDLALGELGDLREKVDRLDVAVAAQNSWRTRYGGYILSGSVGVILGELLAGLR